MALSLKKPTKGGASTGVTARKVVKSAKPRKQQFMLFVGDDGAILTYMEGATVVRRLFAPTAAIDHTRTMTELMQQHPKAPVSIYFDVIDQQYVRQTFPPVSPLSVEGLVKRRLERDFPAEDLKGSLRIGREDTARKDWIYLLISLANTANFQQWVELAVEQPNHLLGAFLVPVECQLYIPLLASVTQRPDVSVSWQMLISHHKVSGFRIVVLREGRLVFTRVSQAIGEAVPAVIAGNVEQEIQNTIEYIRRLGYTEATGLEIFAILASEVRDSIDSKRINASALNLLAPSDVAEALGLHQAALAADRFGDVVISSGMALVGKPALRLYPAYAKKLDQLFKARIAARVAAALVAVGLLLATGNAVIGALGARSESNTASETFAKETATLDLLKKQVEELGQEVNFKNDVAAFYQAIKPEEYSPLTALSELAKMKQPTISIDEWDWSTASIAAIDPNAPPPAVPTGTDVPAGPVSIKVKAGLKGEFPDNETIIAAVNNYKSYLGTAITEYAFTINNPEFGSSNSGKISVALSPEDTETQEQTGTSASPAGGNQSSTSPVLEIMLTGPKAPDAAAVSTQTQPGMQP